MQDKIKIIEKIKSFRVTKQNFPIVGIILTLVLLFVSAIITGGILHAIIVTLSLIIMGIILVTVLPWIESKLPDKKDED